MLNVFNSLDTDAAAQSFRATMGGRYTSINGIINMSAPNYYRYENLKREWLKNHPSATPKQIQKAMRSIARKCGV